MYKVHTAYFNQVGDRVGTDLIYSPGIEPRALREYILTHDKKEFLGRAPAYILATPERTGIPILVIRGGERKW